MQVILYTTHCPKCEVLEQKLKEKKVNYYVNDDLEEMLARGFTVAPMLQIGEDILDFGDAVRFINSVKEGTL